MTALDEFLDDLSLRGIANHDAYRAYVGEYLTFLENRDIRPENVGREDLKAFLASLKSRKSIRGEQLSYYTISKAMSCVSQFYEFLEDEDRIAANPVPKFRRRYLKQYKQHQPDRRKLISVQEMAMLINSVVSSRDRAIMVILAKTGMRVGELVGLDVSNVDLANMSIIIPAKAKRSNRLVFIDQEAKHILAIWLKDRKRWKKADSAIFPSIKSDRLKESQIALLIEGYADAVGLHNPDSKSLSDRFTPHCFRHWWNTHLLRAGMDRTHMKWLRGDALNEAIDIYNHIDPEDVKRGYIAHIPQLGI